MLLASAGFCQKRVSHSVQFELDKFEIAATEKEKLTAWLLQMQDTVSRIEVVGYCDYLGSEEHNMTLSKQRANAVMAFIEQTNNFTFRSSLVSAVGESFSTPSLTTKGKPADRKVEITAIFKKKPKLVSVASTVLKNTPKKPTTSTKSDLLVNAQEGQTVVLSNLNFFPGRHYLVPSAMPELERLIEIMKQNPTLVIEVQGHICCKLDSIDGLDVDTKTYSLSANRAQYIAQQLALAGVEKERIKHRGFAGSRPLVKPELTEQDRQKNRRVEIKILKK